MMPDDDYPHPLGLHVSENREREAVASLAAPAGSTAVVVTQKHSKGEDEVYAEWFYCERCKCESILRSFKYCPGCGAKLDTTQILP